MSDVMGVVTVFIQIDADRSVAEEQARQIRELLQKGEIVDLKIEKRKKARSLDANSYAWLLISKIADVLRTSKDELYIEMLKRYGQREPQLLSVIADAVDMVYRATNNHCCEVGESELNGKTFKHLAILIGSSRYDSKSMGIFIDGVVSEAKELGIQTILDDEINNLIKKLEG
jgi:hypothetical protein